MAVRNGVRFLYLHSFTLDNGAMEQSSILSARWKGKFRVVILWTKNIAKIDCLALSEATNYDATCGVGISLRAMYCGSC